MAIIKDFFKEREKRQQDNDVDYRERIRAHKMAVFIRTVIVIAVLVAIVILVKVYGMAKVYSEVEVTNSVPYTMVSGSKVRNLDGSILVYSKDGASCIDSDGKALWNESYQMQSPIVSICGKTVAIGDYNGREIYVANKNQILGTVKTNLPIRNISVSDNGVVVAVLEDSDVMRLYVYDGNTDTQEPIIQAKATMNKSGYPLAVAMSPNGYIMMVSYFYVDGGKMKSKISFFNFGEVGSNKVDNFVSGYDYEDSVIPYISFMDNNNSYGVTTDRIVLFQGTEIPYNTGSVLLNEKVMGVYSGKGYVGLVFLDITGEDIYKLVIYDEKGNTVGTIPFSMDYTDIVFADDKVIIYGGNDSLIYSVKGEEKFSGYMASAINLLIPNSSADSFTIVTNTAIEKIKLK
ncbi:MAG: DUF5711 family protein [Lachnospiraceae bacterium]|nr:DUF5711 family protein [Lachnospiraceae bacterium]